ncbi:MAG: hypothetical protein M0P31_10470 [Solirubrobacteraceae bacterium]|nr:hypothetical protein [Solirubrobacteraceae bacterium]
MVPRTWSITINHEDGTPHALEGIPQADASRAIGMLSRGIAPSAVLAHLERSRAAVAPVEALELVDDRELVAA